MFSLLIFSFLLYQIPGTLIDQTPKLAGTYTYGGKSEDSPSGQILIHPIDDHTFNFYLDVNRGAPSYNMGQIYGRAFVQADKGIWVFQKTDTTSEKSCALTFSFKKGTVTIKTLSDEEDCGFGYGVIADGKYKRTNTNIPTYYITPTEDTVYFKKETSDLPR